MVAVAWETYNTLLCNIKLHRERTVPNKLSRICPFTTSIQLISSYVKIKRYKYAADKIDNVSLSLSTGEGELARCSFTIDSGNIKIA